MSQPESNQMGLVYLIHFDRPLHHAGHYLGWTTDLVQRRATHEKGLGSKLMKAVTENGIEFEIVRTWNGDRHLERKLKRRKDARSLCPLCKTERRAYIVRHNRQKKARAA